MNAVQLFRGLAAIVSIAFLSALYLFYTGDLDISLVPPTVVALLSFSILFYVAVYHDFSDDDPVFKLALMGLLAVILVVSLLWTTVAALSGVFFPEFEFTVHGFSGILPPEEFLPDWWLLTLLIPSGILLLVGVVVDTDRPSYSTPDGFHELAESPIYFALACAVIGLWGVLFVGLNLVQRIVVVAPIFEELLKFGVALVIGAAIFGRSLHSRVAIALVVGCIFGLVEHSMTYAGEPDVLYMYRVLFHSVTPMVAIAVYTSFENRNLNNLLWIAPIYPICLHYLNNAFAVLSGVVLIAAPEGTQMFVSLVFGALIILLGLVLLVIAITRHDITEVLHREPYSFFKAVL